MLQNQTSNTKCWSFLPFIILRYYFYFYPNLGKINSLLEIVVLMRGGGPGVKLWMCSSVSHVGQVSYSTTFLVYDHSRIGDFRREFYYWPRDVDWWQWKGNHISLTKGTKIWDSVVDQMKWNRIILLHP